MNRVDELLHRYIEEHRRSGRADAGSYLDQVEGLDRVELAAHIDQFHAQASSRPFDPDDFARFRADPRRQAMVNRLMEEVTLRSIREATGETKRSVAATLANALGVVGHESAVRARYHDLEAGTTDPQRVRTTVFASLASMFGVSSERVLAAARNGFAATASGASGAVFARSETSPGSEPGEPDARDDEAVDRAFFSD